MKKKNCFSKFFSLLATGAGLLAGTAQAVPPTVFTIDPTQSVIALSGTGGGIAIGQQGPGSLQTAYTGTINADVAGSTIQFTGGSAINAQTNGNWAPGTNGAGTSPADYGAQAGSGFISVTGALRNLAMDLTSAALPMTNGVFDSGQLIFTIPTNAATEFDYSGFFGSGSELLAGDATNAVANGAGLTTNGSVRTLTLKINSTFNHETSGIGLSVTLTGQFVATNSIVTPQFVISSFAVSNKNLSLAVQNATAQSALQTSTDLKNWTPAAANVTSNGNVTIYTTTVSSNGNHFFRVKK